MKLSSERLTAIDVLRGFDMFFLVGAGDVLRRFFGAFQSDSAFMRGVLRQLDHVEWTGFSAWDIIMPLFLFTSGLSMPFSFAGFLRREGATKAGLYRKVLKRFALLFVLGWIAQGHLLDLSLDTFHVYCNTLHAIAFGYLITALTVMNAHSLRSQIIAGAALLTAYWACLTFIPVPGSGAGEFTPDGNVAIFIDHAVFGRFDDWTQYTWLLTGLAFAATVISGYFAGLLLKKPLPAGEKLKWLTVIGVSLIAGGLLWSVQMPVIKKIWSPSMVLRSSGICYLLLALSFLLTDRLRMTGWWVTGLRYFGLNSITAYMLHTTFHLDGIAGALLHGLEQYAGDFYPFVVSLGEFGVLWLIIRHMYRRGIFLKV